LLLILSYIHTSYQKLIFRTQVSWPSGLGKEFLASAPYVRTFMYTFVIPALLYLSTGLVGYSVGPGISRDARKLTRTPQVIKKKTNFPRL
jgi:hypothetical protein